MFVPVNNLSRNPVTLMIAKCCARLTGKVLISLIPALGSKMGSGTCFKFARELAEYRNSISTGQNLITYLDSGGYSLIQGAVRFNSTTRAIETYNLFVKKHDNVFDRFFSLDIPFWGHKDDAQDLTQENLQKFNEQSTASLKATLANHEAKQKLYFIWHFKHKSQYQVWRDIFKNFKMAEETSRYAIGGLVGLRENFENTNKAKLDFSPFTSMAIKCFAEHLSGSRCSQKFYLHLLGVNHQLDRLQIYLLSEVFTFYCKKFHYPEPEITYDTINYKVSGMLQSQTLKLCSYENGRINTYKGLNSIPKEILEKIFFEEDELEMFNDEKDYFNNNDKYLHVDIVSPLSIYSNLEIDMFLKDTAKVLADIITETNNNYKFYTKLNMKVVDISHGQLAANSKSQMVIINNSVAIYCGFRDLLNGDMSMIDARLEDTIKNLRLVDPFR